MELRIWKRIYLSPFIRLNIYTRGFTVSFGHARIGWVTLGRRGVRETLEVPGVSGLYVTENQCWSQIRRATRQPKTKEAPKEL
jgi:hypothetical protein